MAPRQGLAILYALTESEKTRFEQHKTLPKLLQPTSDRPVWLPPEEAEAIFSFAAAWRRAPKEKPEGWPFNIKLVQLASAGVDVLPEWVWEGPVVACARGVTAVPIAEYTIAAILRDIKQFETIIVRDRAAAERMGNEANWPYGVMRPMRGQTLGLIGYGAIGKATAERAQALGMNVKALRRSRPDDSDCFVDNIDELMQQADQLVICAPSTPQTHHMINERVLRLMKPDAHLINVARGTLLNHDALLRALDEGCLRHATLDVTDPEPLPDGHPLYTHSKVTLTPHMAWYSPDHYERLTTKLLNNLERFASGEPLNDIADFQRGY